MSKNKGDSKNLVKRVDSTEPRSINQSTQQKSDSIKKINRAEESNHYDPKK